MVQSSGGQRCDRSGGHHLQRRHPKPGARSAPRPPTPSSPSWSTHRDDHHMHFGRRSLVCAETCRSPEYSCRRSDERPELPLIGGADGDNHFSRGSASSAARRHRRHGGVGGLSVKASSVYERSLADWLVQVHANADAVVLALAVVTRAPCGSGSTEAVMTTRAASNRTTGSSTVPVFPLRDRGVRASSMWAEVGVVLHPGRPGRRLARAIGAAARQRQHADHRLPRDRSEVYLTSAQALIGTMPQAVPEQR